MVEEVGRLVDQGIGPRVVWLSTCLGRLDGLFSQRLSRGDLSAHAVVVKHVALADVKEVAWHGTLSP